MAGDSMGTVADGFGIVLLYCNGRRYDEPTDTDTEERGSTPRPAPPEEEQYALSSQLVTMVGKVRGRLQCWTGGGLATACQLMSCTTTHT
jgi:hypothetical protein